MKTGRNEIKRNGMKKAVRRGLTLILAGTMITGMLSGCSSRNIAQMMANGLGGNRTKTQETGAPTETGILETPQVFYEEMAEGEYDMATVMATADSAYPGSANSGRFAMDDPGMTDWPGYEEPDWNTEEYKYNPENPWMNVKTSPLSTFAADVDTASYANLRRMIMRGESIPADAIRIEEMINYFRYNYAAPKEGEPFSVTTQIAPCPWNKDTQLMLVGMAAPELDKENTPPSNLVFLIDVSGSMDEPDKLPLVQRAFKLLAQNLDENDRISIVTYAGSMATVLDGTPGDETSTIVDAIEDLMAGGGTNGEGGIEAAYKLAKANFIQGGNNRVILATDGDFNIGMSDEGSLTRMIEDKAKEGIFLSVLGFGYGNISDTNMEALADHGNGNYNYIDDVAEARKVLIEQQGGTLQTVAKDVKLQVEFNPDLVKGYRLIGYENRTMAAEDFADDTKDGGEIGAGHQVTALYEIVPVGSAQEVPEVEMKYGKKGEEAETEAASEDAEARGISGNDYSDEYLTVNIRYKDPDGDTSKLLSYPVTKDMFSEEMSDDLSWAAGVVQFGMVLRESEYAGTTDLKEVVNRLRKVSADMEDTYRDELIWMMNRYSGKGL